MANKQFIGPANRAFTSNGFPAPGATVSLYLSGTLTPANFYADTGLVTPLGPVLTADGAGRFETPAYQDEFTPFRVIYRDASGVQLDDIDPFFFGYEGPRGPQGIQGDVSKVLTRTDLAAIAVGGQPYGLVRYLVEVGYEGIFIWNPADLSANVADDPGQFDYIPPSAGQGLATDGSDGAWQRANVVSIKTRDQLAAMPKSGVFLFDGNEWTFDSSDLSAEVTADVYQGVYVAPSSDTTGASGAWVRTLTNPNVLYVKWFGVAQLNIEATNTAIISAILAQYLPGNITLVFPDGVIPCQVLIPMRSEAYMSTVTVMGETAPATFFGTVSGPPYVMSTKGTILQSNATTSSGISGGVIEVLTSGGFSNVQLVVKNIGVRTYDNPNLHGIMALNAQQLIIDDVDADTGVWSPSAAQPTNVRYGVRTPQLSNGAFTSVNNLSVSGYYVGHDISEHFTGDNIAVTACRYGCEFLASDHASHIGTIGLYRCTTPMLVSGSQRVTIGLIKLEHANPDVGTDHGGIDVPGNIAGSANGWQVTDYDLSDAAQQLKGYGRYVSVKGGVGDDETFVKNGGQTFNVVRLGAALTNYARFSQQNTVSIANSSSYGFNPISIGLTTPGVATEVPNRCVSISGETLILNEAGRYRIRASITFAANSTGYRRALITTTLEVGNDVRPAATDAPTTVEAIAEFDVTSSGVAVHVYGEQDSGAALNIIAAQVIVEQI